MGLIQGLNAYHHPDSNACNNSHEKSCNKQWPCWEDGLEKVSGEFAGTVPLWFQEEADSGNLEEINEISSEELRAGLRCFNRHDNRSVSIVEFGQIRLVTNKFHFVASKTARGHDGTEHICNIKSNVVTSWEIWQFTLTDWSTQQAWLAIFWANEREQRRSTLLSMLFCFT